MWLTLALAALMLIYTASATSSHPCKTCSYTDSVGYVVDPKDSKCFYQCEKTVRPPGYKFHRQCCGVARVWNQASWTCVHAPCKWTGKRQNPNNCASYITCQNGVEKCNCCPAGQSWSGTGCSSNAKCKDKCPEPGNWEGWSVCNAKRGGYGEQFRYRSCCGGCTGATKESRICKKNCGSTCADGETCEDISNCAAYEECVHQKLIKRCCPKGTYWNGAGCHGNMHDGRCKSKCDSSCGCDPNQLVRVKCDKVKNLCCDCHIRNEQVTANGRVCQFAAWSKSHLVIDCMNNRFNGKNVKEFSVMTWFKTTQWAYNNKRTQTILHNGECENIKATIQIYLAEDDNGVWNVKTEVNGNLVGVQEIKTNKLYHVALVRTGTNAVMYVKSEDGTLNERQSITMSDAIGNTKCPWIVGNKFQKDQFVGDLHEFRLYERGFKDAAEVAKYAG